MKRLIFLIHQQFQVYIQPVKWSICFILSLGLTLPSLAQDENAISIRAGFFKDSLIVGDQTQFFIAAHYPKSKTLIFPDSTFSFAPFEYEKRTYFPTETTGEISYDSVIYYLSTFEIERVQRLKLPLYELLAGDSIAHYSNEDTILLTPLVTMSLDTIPAEKLPLKRNVAYQNVSLLFNYPVALIILAGVLVLAVIGWLIFGKKIRNYFRARKLQRAHATFSKAYAGHINQLRNSFSPQATEAALALWKKYMEQLEAKPYTKLTTRETHTLQPDEQLMGSLKTIDGAIYGFAHAARLVEALEHLQHFANANFETILKNVGHGK